MTPAAVIALLVALLLVVSTLLLGAIRRADRAEARLARSTAYRRRLGARMRARQEQVADLRAQMPRAYRVPHPPLAHRADPAATQIMKRGAA